MPGSKQGIGYSTLEEGEVCALDVHRYPLVSILIPSPGERYRVKTPVSPYLTHPLILGTNWLRFKTLEKNIFADGSCHSEVQGDTGLGRAGIPLGISLWSRCMMRSSDIILTKSE